MKTLRPIDVLLVEDDPGDVELTRETIEASKIVVNLHVVEDGLQALAYLRKQANYADAVTPDLIFLDLNIPGKDGRQVLEELKHDETLRTIPVVVLTTSDSDEDIMRSYSLGANCYVTKPTGLDQFIKVVESIESFWFTLVKLPTRIP